ncbi:hypothetical protein AB0M39_25090 [Streptomyces sp. NPDC051907]|uniref:hypothetical protein n=1 Tax=Streptomyces sp. NPDC051907 TaxID=3155284 RepID=UPI0034481B67
MPIDPFAALNAMIRAEVARSAEHEEHGRADALGGADPAAEASPEARRPARDDGAA